MAITNEEAIKFSNEQVRPMAEKMRNLYYEMKAMQADWYNGLSSVIPADTGEIIQDNRTSDSDLSGNDIVGIMVQVDEYIAQIEASGVLGVIQKPCVRKLEVS